MKPLLRCLVLGAWSLLSSVLFGEAPEYPFVKQVEQNFAKWDLDKNGELSSVEIEKAISNERIVGPEAAAVAALFAADRQRQVKKITLPALTQENIVKLVPHAKGDDKTPDLQGMFDGNLKRIQNTKREIFTGKELKLADLHQGRLGDCYCIAPLGWIVHHNPDVLKDLFQVEANGLVTARFPSGKTVKIKPLSDGELSLMGKTNDEGIWIDLFEKSVGLYRARKLLEQRKASPTPEKLPKVPPSLVHAVGFGGPMEVVIELFNGHKCERIHTKKADSPKPEELVKKLRGRFVETQTAKRFAGASTQFPTDVNIPGLTNHHAYACLEYDGATDELVLWNPHGKNFKPAGPAGIENGYSTTQGIFRVPLAQAVQVFNSFVFETSEAVEEKK